MRVSVSECQLVPETKDARAVGDDDNVDRVMNPVVQDTTNVAAVLVADVHALRGSEVAAKLRAPLSR